MQKFGEMYISTYRDNMHQAKLANQHAPDIWVGFTEGHPTGIYQIFNPETKTVILTNNVTFLQKSCWDYIKVKKRVLVTTSYEGSDDDEELKMVTVINNNHNNNNVVNDS